MFRAQMQSLSSSHIGRLATTAEETASRMQGLEEQLSSLVAELHATSKIG